MNDHYVRQLWDEFWGLVFQSVEGTFRTGEPPNAPTTDNNGQQGIPAVHEEEHEEKEEESKNVCCKINPNDVLVLENKRNVKKRVRFKETSLTIDSYDPEYVLLKLKVHHDEIDTKFSLIQTYNDHLDEVLRDMNLIPHPKLKKPPAAKEITLWKAVDFSCMKHVLNCLKKNDNLNVHVERYSLLHMAVERNNLDIVQLLLSQPFLDINFQDKYGCSALHIAVRMSSLQIVELLLKQKANVNLQDVMLRTPLFIAVRLELLTIVELLVKYHANVNIKDIFNETPVLLCSVIKPNIKCLNILLNIEADINVLTKTGISVLSAAVLSTVSTKIIEKLLTHGANVNYQDNYGKRTALHAAAMTGNVGAVKLLLRHGADPNILSRDRKSPRDLALEHKHYKIASIISENK